MQELQQEESPVETTAPAAPVDEVQSLLDEFDRRKPEPDAPVPSQEEPNAQSQDQPIDDWLKALDGNDQKVTELQGQVDAMRTAEHRRAELEVFNKFADDLQKDMPSHVPADYTRAKLESLAHNPEIAQAWDFRNVDRQAANLELQKVQLEIANQQRQPVPDTAQIAQLSAYARQLDIAVRSHSILRKVTLGIINDAKKIPLPLSDEAMEIKADVAAAMRGASAPIDLKEPPPNFATMTDNELRQYTKQFGF